MKNSGNQHASPKVYILALLGAARVHLNLAAEWRTGGRYGAAVAARREVWRAIVAVNDARTLINATPASTRRRWACGR